MKSSPSQQASERLLTSEPSRPGRRAFSLRAHGSNYRPNSETACVLAPKPSEELLRHCKYTPHKSCFAIEARRHLSRAWIRRNGRDCYMHICERRSRPRADTTSACADDVAHGSEGQIMGSPTMRALLRANAVGLFGSQPFLSQPPLLSCTTIRI
ncbi:hypothetical protein PYCCODRAFT_853845 [Trametes coccinea BRFM310]|uniref:Uncharacterized protein n=1 Tax=Trametes coccinea (strain BRFM310) TaxID=1353009 RepID=A0A1Y2IDQ8_TRAC3|nr:hypothetical protein PYCCODRAFT_853845 [Trametes coccinea BRFM310]